MVWGSLQGPRALWLPRHGECDGFRQSLWKDLSFLRKRAISDPSHAEASLGAEASLLWLFLRLSRDRLAAGSPSSLSLACDTPWGLFWEEGSEGRQRSPSLPSQLLLFGRSDIC